MVSVVVQSFMLGYLLKRFSTQRLAVIGLVSSTLAYLLWGAATEGWMMYAIVVANVLGATVTAAVHSLISSADSRSQGQTLGAVSSLSSLMAVVAPALGVRPCSGWCRICRAGTGASAHRSIFVPRCRRRPCI